MPSLKPEFTIADKVHDKESEGKKRKQCAKLKSYLVTSIALNH